MKFKEKAEQNNFQRLLDRFRAFASGSGGSDRFGTTRIYTGGASDPEIKKIRETRFSPADKGMTAVDTAGYQNSMNKLQGVYSQLLAEGQSGAQQTLVPAEQRDGFFTAADTGYQDPYGDIKTDVRKRVDDLMKTDPSTGSRSTAERTAAVTGMLEKLVPEGNPQASAYLDLIKTPSYESFVGSGTSMDRARAMAAANQAAAEARRPSSLAFFDELVQRMKG